MNIRSIIKNVSCLVLLLILSFIFLINTVSAETKTFIKEYTYQASDEDSKNSSRTIALREVKRLLLEELGTYLESQTEVINFKLTKDQIVTLTAGIVQTELIEEKWNTENLKYWLKAKITANPQDVIKSIDSLRKDRAKVKELEELRKKSEELLKENERLTKELKTAKGYAKQETAQAYKRNIDNLSATEWFEKGESLFNAGNHTAAIKAFSKALELNPQEEEAYNSRGISYEVLGNHQQAINNFSQYIKINPRDVAPYFNRGNVYRELGNYQQAIKDYSKAIELESDADSLSFYYSLRGAAYGKLKNNQQAIKDYSKAIELNSDAGGLSIDYSNRASVYIRLGNFRQALEDQSKAIELNPRDDAEAYGVRGAIYYGLGNYQQAITDYNKAIELNPKYAALYYCRGLVYDEIDNHSKAINDMKIAAKLGYKEAQNYLSKRRK
ncbi:MAG: tetratricopeptide repeat protein [Deltaproteobacteria bacterium]